MAQIQAPLPQRYTIDAMAGRPTALAGQPARVETTTTASLVEPSWRNPVLWFIVVALVVGVLLWVFKPSIVLSVNPSTGQTQVDWGKLVGWAIGVTIVAALFFWWGRATAR